MAASKLATEPDSREEGWLDFVLGWPARLGIDVPSLGLGSSVSIESSPRPEMAVVLVAQAYVAWVLGTIGCVARAGLSWAGYGAILARQLGAISLEQRGQSSAVRTLLDESAAQLRELGELSVQEARALQKNLLQLAERLRELEDGTLDEPRRYAKAKH